MRDHELPASHPAEMPINARSSNDVTKRANPNATTRLTVP